MLEEKKSQDFPPEILDLLRFMCETWSEIDKWAYENCDGDALAKYPVIQGTSNQMRIREIGNQPYDSSKLKDAVTWMLK